MSSIPGERLGGSGGQGSGRVAGELKSHWEQIYRTRAPTELSWHQASLDTSCEFIAATGVSPAAPILDVGAGASLLVDTLLEAGFSDLTVLDIARAALQRVRERLGPKSEAVKFVEADITDFHPRRRFALWHDRAVFHFLTDPADRRRYRLAMRRILQPGGHVIIATFALTGPTRCSGLEVVRYSAASLVAELGEGLALVESLTQTHITPSGREQQFLYCRFRARPVGVRHGCRAPETQGASRSERS